MQATICCQTPFIKHDAQQVFLSINPIWSTLCAGTLLSILLLPFLSDATADAMASLFRALQFSFSFHLHLRKTPFECIVVSQKQKHCFHFVHLSHQPPHISSSSTTREGWNDIQTHSTSADTNKRRVKWLYWPPHLTCLDSLRQFTPTTSCPAQARKYSTQRKERQEQEQKSIRTILTKTHFLNQKPQTIQYSLLTHPFPHPPLQ